MSLKWGFKSVGFYPYLDHCAPVHCNCCSTRKQRESAAMWTVVDQQWRCLGTTTSMIKPKVGRRGAVRARVVSSPWRTQMCILGLDAKKRVGSERTCPGMTATFGTEVREEAVRTCADVPAEDNVMYEQGPANWWTMNFMPRPGMKCGQCRSVVSRELGRACRAQSRLGNPNYHPSVQSDENGYSSLVWV